MLVERPIKRRGWGNASQMSQRRSLGYCDARCPPLEAVYDLCNFIEFQGKKDLAKRHRSRDFLANPVQNNKQLHRSSLQRKPESRTTLRSSPTLHWIAAFAAMTLFFMLRSFRSGSHKKPNCPPDGPCGTKMAYKARLAGSLVFSPEKG